MPRPVCNDIEWCCQRSRPERCQVHIEIDDCGHFDFHLREYRKICPPEKIRRIDEYFEKGI